MEAKWNSGEQSVYALLLPHRPVSIEHFHHGRSQSIHGHSARLPVAAQEVSALMGQGKTLLIIGIRAVQKDDALAMASDQAGAERAVREAKPAVDCLLLEPAIDGRYVQPGQEDHREGKGVGDGPA